MRKFKAKKRKKKIVNKSEYTLNSIIENEIKSNSLRKKFSKKIEQHLEKLEFKISNIHKNLNKTNFITIDGEDSRDFDDAVWAQQKNNFFEIMVAISDVSYFVKENDVLDDEAKKRANSFYFPNKVLPMFPERISNDLCSLVPNKKKLCLIVYVKLTLNGKIINSKIFRASIISKARFTYTQIEAYLSKKKKLNNELRNVVDSLYNVFKILNKRSNIRGKINLEIEEDKIVIDKDNENYKFVKRKNERSNKIIEELMVLANNIVATKLVEKKIKTLFRNHEKPTEEKLLKLLEFLKNNGVKFKKTNSISPKDFYQILKLKKNPNYKLIKENVLKSQSKAYYHFENKGHFGLSLKNYTHFTSPIRRYSDLIVHRNIVNQIINSESENTDFQVTDNLCKHLLDQEKKSEKIERSIIEKACCLYLKKIKIKKFFGYIDGLTEYGIFIKANDYPFSGLVFLKDLRDDYYDFDKKKLLIHGRNNGIIFEIGQKVSFKIKNNDVKKGLISLKNIEKII